ncbi:Imm1 family immunity protein [Streptacidiphilus sp. N1-3]|uniref:Imm1 family immunity protein n=1 Tax=Streptacidiphilus alkalitolerans TaxID=3342712 RepID=A0ABV6X2X0_9ACTN
MQLLIGRIFDGRGEAQASSDSTSSLGSPVGLKARNSSSEIDPGYSIAEFTISQTATNSIEVLGEFDGYLHVSINYRSRYGALKWLRPRASSAQFDGGITGLVWISNNPNPPAEDPHVVADADLSSYYDQRSTLFAPEVRAAVEEFCRTATGERPACIEWTPGELSGRRLDSPVPRGGPEICDDPWCENQEPGHPYHGIG